MPQRTEPLRLGAGGGLSGGLEELVVRPCVLWKGRHAWTGSEAERSPPSQSEPEDNGAAAQCETEDSPPAPTLGGRDPLGTTERMAMLLTLAALYGYSD